MNSKEPEHPNVSKITDECRHRQCEEYDFSEQLQLDPKQLKNVRKILRRYRAEQTTENENRILAEAISKYKLSVEDETDKRAFAVLLLSYISIPTLTAFQISEQLHIDKRTVYKDISKGVAALCVLIFGIDAFAVPAPDEYDRIRATVCKCINEIYRKEV